MTDKEQQWDQVLGDKLRRLRPDYRAESWDALADRLREEETDLVTPADTAVAAAIEKIQPQYTAESWDKLSALLDIEESVFDEQVASAMHNIHPTYRPGSWAALAARLELAAYRRISIWQTKSLEVATAFVLLLAFWVFFPYFSPTRPAPSVPAQAQLLAAQNGISPQAELAPAIETPAENTGIKKGGTNPVAAAVRASGKGPRNRIKSAVGTPARSFYLTPLTRQPFTINLADKKLAVNSVERLQPIVLTPVDARTEFAPIGHPDRAPAEVVAPLAYAEIQPFDRVEAEPVLSRKLKRTRSPLVQNWGLIGTHWDQNVVFTPSFILKRPFAAETRLSRGRTVGVTYSMGYGRHRWETGLLYRMKQYFPSYIVLTDDRERTVNRMRYHSVSIPVSYQPTVLRFDRWSAYLNVGVSFNATLDAHIAIEDSYRTSLQNPTATPRSEAARRAENFGEHRGLLQGGKFSNNAAVYTLLGAGIEYRLPSGLSFFLQPTATRRIVDFGQDGEGPLQERINSNSILFGFKREF